MSGSRRGKRQGWDRERWKERQEREKKERERKREDRGRKRRSDRGEREKNYKHKQIHGILSCRASLRRTERREARQVSYYNPVTGYGLEERKNITRGDRNL